MAEVIREDDNSYYTDTGNYVPKATMSPAVRELYQSKLNDYQSRTGMIPATAPVQNTGMSPVSTPTQSVMQPAVSPIPLVPVDTGEATAAEYVAPALPPKSPPITTAGMPTSMTTAVEGPQSSITQKSIAPATQKAMDKAATGLINAEKAKTDAELEAVKLESDINKRAAEKDLETSEIINVREKNRQTETAELKNDHAAAVKELAGMKVDPNKIWANKTTGDKIQVGIGILLGAFGQALTGGKSNYALDVIDQAIDRDIAAQKANIGAKQVVVGEKANAIAMLRQRFGDERLADITFKQAALERVKSEFFDKIVATKSAEVRARGQKAIAGIDEMISKIRLEATAINETRTSGGQRVATTVETPKPGAGGRAPTEFEGKAAMFAAGAEQAERNFKDIEGKGYSRGSWSEAALKVLPEATRSELQKRQNQAELAFADAFLRQTSGAAISADERADAARRFFPRAGDSAEVLKQKEADRNLQISVMKQLSGRQAQMQPAVYTPPSYAGAK